MNKTLRGIVTLLALTTLSCQAVSSPDGPAKLTLKEGSVVIFIGDSITDDGRDKKKLKANEPRALGRGYAAMAAGTLLGDYADLDLQIYNRGISGNKIPDLAARWQKDVIDLKPDVVSILIGVNDLWHQFAFGSKYKATVEDYLNGYRELIEWTQKEVPGVQIVICEPFTLRTSKHFAPLADYAVAARTLAEEKKLTFVPFQSALNDAAKGAPAKFWLWDGVHPTLPCHALLARFWRKATGL
jgi:lysophospholipase L1-like esterase